jgi:hypothetical protein
VAVEGRAENALTRWAINHPRLTALLALVALGLAGGLD